MLSFIINKKPGMRNLDYREVTDIRVNKQGFEKFRAKGP